MPLPIHGEFTYQPPSDREKKILLRRERASRLHSQRSPILPLLLWTLFMSAICVATGWSFRHRLADLFLRRPTQVAKQSAQPTEPNPSPDTLALPANEAPSPTGIDSDMNRNVNSGDGVTSVVPPPTEASKLDSQVLPAAKHLAPKVSASRPNIGSLPSPSGKPEAPEISRSYAADSAPLLPPTSQPASVLRVPPPQTIPATNASDGAPTLNTAAPPARLRPAADAPAFRRSAIGGSISNPPRPSDFAAGGPSNATAVSAPSVSSQSSSPNANSFAARNSNTSNLAPGNSAVIQMDVPEARVIEVTPPRSLTGNLTASFVNLPGERVLRSGSITMHIERSVRIPGDRIPGERWLWRGHKKVVLGELASRVDPQVSQLPAPYGSIAVLATIDKEGYITNVKPLYGSLAYLPNVAAAIRNWRYQPTYLENKPVETEAQIEIDFHPPAARASKP
jgi:hypothetical protein